LELVDVGGFCQLLSLLLLFMVVFADDGVVVVPLSQVIRSSAFALGFTH